MLRRRLKLRRQKRRFVSSIAPKQTASSKRLQRKCCAEGNWKNWFADFHRARCSSSFRKRRLPLRRAFIPAEEDFRRWTGLLSLRELYRAAMNALDSGPREEALNLAAGALQTEPKARGIAFVDYLFVAQDLDILAPPHASAVKKTVFQRMEKHQNRYLLESIIDIWYYLSKDEIDEFTNICLSCVIYGSTQDTRVETKSWLNRNSWEKMPEELRANILTPLQRWIENYELFNDTSHADIVRELKAIAERR